MALAPMEEIPGQFFEGRQCYRVEVDYTMVVKRRADHPQVTFKDVDGEAMVLSWPSSEDSVLRHLKALDSGNATQARVDVQFSNLSCSLLQIQDETENIVNENMILKEENRVLKEQLSFLNVSRRRNDERVRIQDRIFCPMPCLRGAHRSGAGEGETYDMIAYPGQFLLVKFRKKGTRPCPRPYPVEVRSIRLHVFLILGS
eukprot:TRINITY_DN7303_c0_g6_i1.p1 TRINITY_DN7303_c0_g6~~TRINITY_DN7303_c0_g6_i1.p1  ORF type:complete len:201 (-),score=24.16 TRINITY_DN7303_c0_g6_i1:293-895(-)